MKRDIEKAVAGEPEAVDAVLRHYSAHIKYEVIILNTQIIAIANQKGGVGYGK